MSSRGLTTTLVASLVMQTEKAGPASPFMGVYNTAQTPWQKQPEDPSADVLFRMRVTTSTYEPEHEQCRTYLAKPRADIFSKLGPAYC